MRATNSAPLTTPMFAAVTINGNLPNRFKLDDAQLILRILSFSEYTKRQLLKDVRGEWKSLGYIVKRGFVFIPLELFISRWTFMIDALNAMLSGQLDAKAISNDQYNEAAWEFVDSYRMAG